MNYWTDKEEELIQVYNNSDSKNIKNHAAKLLIPKIQLIIDGIVESYRLKKIDEFDKEDILSWAFTIIPKIDTSIGRAFSYLTFCIKNRLVKINKKKYTIQWHGVTQTSNVLATEDIDRYWDLINSNMLTNYLLEEIEAIYHIFDTVKLKIESKKAKRLYDTFMSVISFDVFNKKTINSMVKEQIGVGTKESYRLRQSYLVPIYKQVLKEEFDITSFSANLI